MRPESCRHLRPNAKQAVGGGIFRQLGAAGTVGLERYQSSIEREDARGGLGRLLGIAVDAAHPILGGGRARHGVEQVAALRLQGSQPLDVRLLAEGGACALECRQHARRIDLGALASLVDGSARP